MATHSLTVNATVHSILFAGALVLDDSTRIIGYVPTGAGAPTRSGRFSLAPGQSAAAVGVLMDSGAVSLSYSASLGWMPTLASGYLLLTQVGGPAAQLLAGAFPSGAAQGGDAVALAIQAAISAAAGGVKVIWKNQNNDQPEIPYIALSFGGFIEQGQDWVQTSQDLTRAAGSEIEFGTAGFREVTLQLEGFTSQTVPGEQAANGLIDRVKTGLGLPSARSLLRAAGVAPFDAGPVDYVPAVVAVGFRGRATCDIRCSMPAPNVYELAGYIQRIAGTITATGGGAGGPITDVYGPTT